MYPQTPPDAGAVRQAYLLGTEFTRPADTTAYAVGDLVGNSTSALTAIELTHAALATGRGGWLLSLILSKDGTTVTNATFRAHFWTKQPATSPGNDNAGFGMKYANADHYLGYLDFPTMEVGTGSNTGARAILVNQNFPYKCDATSLFWVLEARAAYTPASAEKFRLDAMVLRD